MDERLGFIARLLEGEKMSPLCGNHLTRMDLRDRDADVGIEPRVGSNRRGMDSSRFFR